MRKNHKELDDKLKAAFGEGDTAWRKMMYEFSRLMGRQKGGDSLVSTEKFIKGKLAFIDKYKLPIRVSFQSLENDLRGKNV